MVGRAEAGFRGESDASTLLPDLLTLASSHYHDEQHVQAALAQAWVNLLGTSLDDHLLTQSEESHLVSLVGRYDLPAEVMVFGGASIERGRALREILEGRVPSRPRAEGSENFAFQKTERLIWTFPNVRCLEEATRRHYEGGSHGVSIRIVKGVYYRQSAFKGRPVDTTYNRLVGTGALAVTTRHLYFAGDTRSLRVRHDKVVSVVPYSDGVTIHREAASAKPLTFMTDDAWFLAHVLQNASHLDSN